jgi:hypothetical protein
MGKIVRAGAGAGTRIFDKLESEPELEPDNNDWLRNTDYNSLSLLRYGISVFRYMGHIASIQALVSGTDIY